MVRLNNDGSRQFPEEDMIKQFQERVEELERDRAHYKKTTEEYFYEVKYLKIDLQEAKGQLQLAEARDLFRLKQINELKAQLEGLKQKRNLVQVAKERRNKSREMRRKLVRKRTSQ